MKTLILIALFLIDAASAPVAKPASSITIDLAGDGSINVETYTYGGPDQVAHFCSTATISYPNGSYLSVLTVTNTSVSDGANEYLDADVSQTPLTKFYNPTTGQLTLSSVASVATYQQVLRSVYYVDALTSPTVGPRLIDVQASYGTTGSNTAVCTLSVQRNPHAAPSTTTTHSATAAAASPSVSSSTPTTAHLSQTLTPAQTLTPPYVDLSGGNGGPNWSTWTYGGPSYYSHICPSAIVSYTGTLTSATITLTNRPDGSSEYMAVQNFALNGLSTQGYNPGTGQLIITGSMDSAVYQALLRSIVYVDLNTTPHASDRTITVKVTASLQQSNIPVVTMGVSSAPSTSGKAPPLAARSSEMVPLPSLATSRLGAISRISPPSQPISPAAQLGKGSSPRTPNFLPAPLAGVFGTQWSEAYCRQQVLKFSSWADDQDFWMLSSLLDTFLTRKNQPRYDITYFGNQTDDSTVKSSVRNMVCTLIYNAWNSTPVGDNGSFKLKVTQQKVYWWPDKILDPTQPAFSAFISKAQGYPLQWYQRNDLLFFTFGGAQISLDATIRVTRAANGDLVFSSDPNDDLAVYIYDGFSFDDPWWQQLPRQTLFGYLSTFYTACRTLELTYGYTPFNDQASFLDPISFRLSDYNKHNP